MIVPLTKSQYMLIDKEDFDKLPKNKPFAQWSNRTSSYYARFNLPNGYKPLVARFIMGLERGDKRQVDHINHETLDNRRSNLRIVSASENQANRRLFNNNTTGYCNVSYHKRDKKYQAYQQVKGKRKHLGYFKTAEEAAHASRRGLGLE